MGVRGRSVTAMAFAGLCGSATWGASALASKSCRSPGASASLCQGAGSMSGAPVVASQARVMASGATRPTWAPSSALILARVMRSCMPRAATAPPQNSTAW